MKKGISMDRLLPPQTMHVVIHCDGFFHYIVVTTIMKTFIIFHLECLPYSTKRRHTRRLVNEREFSYELMVPTNHPPPISYSAIIIYIEYNSQTSIRFEIDSNNKLFSIFIISSTKSMSAADTTCIFLSTNG